MLEVSLPPTTVEEVVDCCTVFEDCVDDWTLTLESSTAPTSPSPDICLKTERRERMKYEGRHLEQKRCSPYIKKSIHAQWVETV